MAIISFFNGFLQAPDVLVITRSGLPETVKGTGSGRLGLKFVQA